MAQHTLDTDEGVTLGQLAARCGTTSKQCADILFIMGVAPKVKGRGNEKIFPRWTIERIRKKLWPSRPQD